jgi:hypothetical protein
MSNEYVCIRCGNKNDDFEWMFEYFKYDLNMNDYIEIMENLEIPILETKSEKCLCTSCKNTLNSIKYGKSSDNDIVHIDKINQLKMDIGQVFKQYLQGKKLLSKSKTLDEFIEDENLDIYYGDMTFSKKLDVNTSYVKNYIKKELLKMKSTLYNRDLLDSRDFKNE